MKKIIKELVKKMGYQIKGYPDHDFVRRMRIVNSYKIDTLLDIGANVGNYALDMRSYGYNGRIISFEPLSRTFNTIKKNAIGDNNWLVNNYALGNKNERTLINVSSQSDTSSILNILPEQIKNAPSSVYIAKEEIEVKTIDSIYHSFCTNEDNVMIKIDTQGYEKFVLEGATKSLRSVKIVQLEMSLIPLYENEALFLEMIKYLEEKEFMLFSLENGFSNEVTGQLLQVDGIFVNKNYLTNS